MKKTLIIVMAILILSVFTYSQSKIGIINPQKLLEVTKKGKAVSQKIQNISSQKEATLKNMQSEIKRLEKELMSPALNTTAKESKALELQNKKTATKRFYEDTQREMQMLYQQEMQKLQQQIIPIIQRVGKEKGLTVILEVTNVAYYDPAADITNEIIKIMDGQ